MALNALMTVCTGNICRSPLAQGLFAQQLPHTRVYSAGLAAVIGHPATPETVALAHGMGVDIGAHRAQQISAFLVQSASLILTAEQAQKQWIEKTYPASRGRVFLIAQTQGMDVPDPYRQDEAAYQSCGQLIAQSVRDWVLKIEKL
jgi:protein-tyrosine phosphatase